MECTLPGSYFISLPGMQADHVSFGVENHRHKAVQPTGFSFMGLPPLHMIEQKNKRNRARIFT
jgi:hypothetical protein